MKPITIDEFCNLTFLSNVSFSPDGKAACFAAARADKEGNKYTSCLYVRKNGKILQLTSGGKEGSFCWENSDTVLFSGNREESKSPALTSRYYRISLNGGEATLAYTFPIPTHKLIPLNGGDALVIGSVFPGYEELYKGNVKVAKALLDAQKENEDYEVVTQVPWWWNGSSFIQNGYSGLFHYSAKKKALTWLTPKGMDVSDVKLSADGKSVYYAMMDVSVPMPDYYRGEDIFCMDIRSRERRQVVTSRADFSVQTYELGKNFMLLIASDGGHGMNTDPDFYTMDYTTGEVTLCAKYGQSIGGSVGSDVRRGGGRVTKMMGDTLYFISTRFDSACLYKLENGTVSPVIDKEGSIDCFDMYEDQMLLVALWDMRAQELYDGYCGKLSSFNDEALKNKYIAKPEKLNFTTQGHEIHGFVLKPKDYKAGQKYPVILDIHGGPKTVYGPVFYHEMQYWTSLGYFVIYCNPTGSDGRGEFADIRGKYGTVDYEDIMAFCDEALAAYPDMDESNFFETGGSYGGFMTNWIIGHTNRFKACASQRSISNWISFYGVSDIGVGFSEDQNAATIWPDIEKMWWHSPMKYADKCTTPTLFIHSFEDYRCPIDQGYQMYSALVAHGVESKMVLFKGENHDLSRSGKPKHRLRRLDEITKWFENHKG